MSMITEFINFHINEVIPRCWELLTAPMDYPDMWAIVGPLAMTLICMEFYFGRYKTEQISWDSAFGNTIALFFVTAALLHQLFIRHNILLLVPTYPAFGQLLVVIGLAIIAIMLALGNYFHKTPKNILQFASSAEIITVISFVISVIIFANIPLSFTTLYAATINLVLSFPIFAAFRGLIEPSTGTQAALTRKQRIIQRENYFLKQKIIRKVKMCKHKKHTPNQALHCFKHLVQLKFRF